MDSCSFAAVEMRESMKYLLGCESKFVPGAAASCGFRSLDTASAEGFWMEILKDM